MNFKVNALIILSVCFFAFSAKAQNSNEYILEKIEELSKEVEMLKVELKESKEECKELKAKCQKDSLLCTKAQCEKQEQKSEKKEKKGEGKFILRSFVNFNSQTQAGVTNVAFKLDRSYIGYEYTFNNGLKLKSIIDFGKPSALDDYHYVAYIKNALVSWTRKGFTINGGMIQTTQSALQEKIWAKRYIMMVFHDQYKFGSSADLGFSMEYKFTDWVKADFIMVNGEGYKKIQSNKGFLYGLGATFNPTEKFYIRLYADLNNSRLEGKSNIYGYSALMAYKNDKFTVSGEFNMMQNYKNAKGQNLLGCSVYGSAKVSKLIDVYARYDLITSNKNWNADNDKHAIIAGFEILPCKYVKLSPNFRMDIPQHGGDNKYMAYLNCCFQL